MTAGSAEITFGGLYSTCSLIASINSVALISTFQMAEAQNLGPNFGYQDGGDGSAIWGLYIAEGGERGQEWLPGVGTPTLTGYQGEFALIAPGGITFDPAGEGIEPDGEAYLVAAEWSGETIENSPARRTLQTSASGASSYPRNSSESSTEPAKAAADAPDVQSLLRSIHFSGKGLIRRFGPQYGTNEVFGRFRAVPQAEITGWMARRDRPGAMMRPSPRSTWSAAAKI